MMSAQLDILGDLITAQYEPGERRRVLRRANLTLERLRYLYRLARDMQCLSTKDYERAAIGIVEVGRQIGGWARSAGLPVTPQDAIVPNADVSAEQHNG